MKPIHAHDSEIEIIGCLIVYFEQSNKILTGLNFSADWLDNLQHQRDYRQIMKLNETEIAPTIASISDMTKIDVEYYIEKMTVIHYLASHAGIVKAAYQKRELRKKLIGMLEEVEEPSSDVNETLVRMTLLADKLIEQSESGDRNPHEEMIRAVEGTGIKPQWLPPPIVPLRNIVKTFKIGKMSVIASRPSQGKTSLGLNIAMSLANPFGEVNVPVGIISQEMDYDEIMNKNQASITKINTNKYTNDCLSETEAKEWIQVCNELKTWPIYINDKPMNIFQIESQIKLWAHKYGIRFVLVDYIQLINTKGLMGNKQEQISKISHMLTLMARKYDVHVCCLSQLKRPNPGEKERTPRMDDLKDSGQIEQDAYLIMLLYDDPEAKYSSMYTAMIIDVVKQRGDRTGRCKVCFVKPCSEFADYEKAREIANEYKEKNKQAEG